MTAATGSVLAQSSDVLDAFDVIERCDRCPKIVAQLRMAVRDARSIARKRARGVRTAHSWEARTAEAADPRARLNAYIRAIAEVMRPASGAFFEDLAAHPDVRALYGRNQQIAGERLARLIADGVASGDFRPVDATFVADLIAAETIRIQAGEVDSAGSLDYDEAHEALASVVLGGISA